jgi:hypothetical protein
MIASGSPVLGVEQKHEPAVEPGLDGVLVLDAHAAVVPPRHDVGLHPDGVAVEGFAGAFHGAPTMELAYPAGLGVDVDPWAADQIAPFQLPVSLLERAEGPLHREDLLDVVVVEKEHGGLLSASTRQTDRPGGNS